MLLFVLLVVFLIFAYFKLVKPLEHWKNQGIPYQKPWPIVGNMGAVFFRQKSIFDLVWDFYKTFPNARYNGLYQFSNSTLLIRDVDLIKQVFVKDFDYFHDHKPLAPEGTDRFLGKELFSLNGPKWRDMRATLSPSFTSSKMKAMFHLLIECAQNFTNYFEEQNSNMMIVQMKDIFSRYTNDAIATVAFGLRINSLQDRKNTFYLMGEDATSFTGLRAIKIMVLQMAPKLMKSLGQTFFPSYITDYFHQIIIESIRQREEQGIIRPDLIHLLTEARKGRLKHDDTNEVIDSGFAVAEESEIGRSEIRNKKPQLTDDDITAQAFLFFFAGFDTSSTLMSFLAYELALNPDIQTRLQEEINETLQKCNGKITYEKLLGMKYLDMVISEALRKWPPGFMMDRICVKDYTLKPQKEDEKPVTVRKGDFILISAIGIHRDPKYFADPDKFDPERFNDDNKRKIVPYSYMPFGFGPRNCIGSRLALLESKILMFHVLSKFSFEITDKTPIPLTLEPKPFNVMPTDGLWLGIKPRKSVF